MTTAQILATYGASLNGTELPPEVIHHAKRAVVDWYAALLAGAMEPPALILEKALSDDLDRGPSQLALGRSATPRTAALINGTAAHTAEVDDIYREAIYHPGAPTIAAALAQGQAHNASGMHFLRAVIAGYEISTRIGSTMGRAHYRYWHNTGTIGTFGAAAAAAAILDLDAIPYAHALCTAATVASGLQQAFRMDSMSKPLHAGHAAEAGLLAAQAASAGFTGSLDVIDGEAGIGKAMSDGPDWKRATATLGQEYNITCMTFKNHACCGHTFAPIDGALALQAQLGVKPEDIQRVSIATYSPALDVAGNFQPTTAAEARFSVPFVVATALLYGSVRLAAFTEQRLSDPRIRDLMTRMDLTVAPDLDAAFPGQRAARVMIRTADGRQAEYFQPTRKGDPEQPLTDDELSAKFMELAQPVVGEQRAKSILQALWTLESRPGLMDL
ncbi:2-methylcitrate dehydratase [Pollutimonas subterranea]|uniref:2-methylcitrate dehydratase n=1 Tax=Pollutimonas subterranea TaxID=2045210 RepID=A0A2N4U486_9BURK|nr:MmgE/PrpD family protein [Pollutimonas subterranea]PLC49835.1 2-methylcitrate dehydratase [Pollutimonas subterranea]